MTNFRGCVLGAAALTATLGLAVTAHATTIMLAPAGAGTVSGATFYATNETLVFNLAIKSPDTFKFSATGSGGTFPFPISESLSGMSGTYSLTYGPFPVSGTVDYTLTTAVPEPASWALMIVGLAVVGGYVRRRHPGKAAA